MKAVGIDIGTTSICLAEYDTVNNRVGTVRNTENVFISGTFCQDPERIVSVIEEQLELMNVPAGVDVIGVSSQMHGILYIDNQGKAVSPFYTWKDESGNISLGEETCASYLSRVTGCSMHAGYGTVTHYYLGRTGRIPENAVYLANIGDYLVMRLCGNKVPLMGAGIAASLGGLDPNQLTRSLDTLKAAGVDIRYYPEMAAPEQPAGNWRGIPVCHAMGDNQASFYAAVGEDESKVSINVGTGSQVSLYTKSCEGLLKGEVRPYTPGGCLCVQASVNGGKVYEKLAVFLKEIISAFTGEMAEQDLPYLYSVMEKLGNLKKETDLRIIPALYGDRVNGGSGSVEGLTEHNFHPADLVRAYTAGMAEELYQLYMDFPVELRKGRNQIVVSGNGIRKNALLQQEIVKRFGLPVIAREHAEEAAAGAAMMACRLWEAGSIM